MRVKGKHLSRMQSSHTQTRSNYFQDNLNCEKKRSETLIRSNKLRKRRHKELFAAGYAITRAKTHSGTRNPTAAGQLNGCGEIRRRKWDQ